MSADDDSNHVVIIESTENPEEDDRPLMQLFHRLISQENKQNTLLTNVQILSILKKEFNIDVTQLHDLEVDIFLNVIKKFLKDWPKWEEFDRGIKKIKQQKQIQKTLEEKYKDLKEYLEVMMDTVQPLAHQAVANMLKEHEKKMEKVDTSDIIFEVICSRQQLNELVLNQPVPETNNIFNYVEHQPTNISLMDIPLESILNYGRIQIKIDLKFFTYKRIAMHQMKHVLVNKHNGERNIRKELNECVQIKDSVISSKKDVTLHEMENLLQEIIQRIPNSMQQFFSIIFTTIMSDFQESNYNIKVPGAYRQFCNKYPYYRKLFKEQKSGTGSGVPYDLYIEETISPLIMFTMFKIGAVDALPPKYNWITIECGECNITFNDLDIFHVSDHFKTYHTHEKDWMCSNCNKSFSMTYLTQNRWKHACNT